MSWSATRRIDVRVAPGGLALVQDLVNSQAFGSAVPDLLADAASAARWLAAARDAWESGHSADERGPEERAAPARLSEAELRRLRSLRDGFVALCPYGTEGGETLPRLEGRSFPARLSPDAAGRVSLRPSGHGVSWLESAVWSEVLLAQLAGTWPRLKLCRNRRCGSAFYDTSRNNSGAWHDVHTCGNQANLRASRARARARAELGEPDTRPGAGTGRRESMGP